MNQLFGKQYIGYVKELDFLGAVTSVDFLGDTVTLTGDEDTHVVDREEVEFLPEVGVFKGVTIFHKDVLSLQEVDDAFVEVELHSDGLVQLHALDKDFNRIYGEDGVGEKFDFNEGVATLEIVLEELVGSIYELKGKEAPEEDFIVDFVKDIDGEHVTYFTAYNNVDVGEVDLIKVMTATNSKYERRTLARNVYFDSILHKTLVVVSSDEIEEFIQKSLNSLEDSSCCEDCCEVKETEEVEPQVKEEVCNDCKKLVIACDCLW